MPPRVEVPRVTQATARAEVASVHRRCVGRGEAEGPRGRARAVRALTVVLVPEWSDVPRLGSLGRLVQVLPKDTVVALPVELELVLIVRMHQHHPHRPAVAGAPHDVERLATVELVVRVEVRARRARVASAPVAAASCGARQPVVCRRRLRAAAAHEEAEHGTSARATLAAASAVRPSANRHRQAAQRAEGPPASAERAAAVRAGVGGGVVGVGGGAVGVERVEPVEPVGRFGDEPARRRDREGASLGARGRAQQDAVLAARTPLLQREPSRRAAARGRDLLGGALGGGAQCLCVFRVGGRVGGRAASRRRAHRDDVEMPAGATASAAASAGAQPDARGVVGELRHRVAQRGLGGARVVAVPAEPVAEAAHPRRGVAAGQQRRHAQELVLHRRAQQSTLRAGGEQRGLVARQALRGAHRAARLRPGPIGR